MGVLNVQEKLRHRVRAAENNSQYDSTWEEQFFQAPAHPAAAQPSPVRSRSRKCKPQSTAENARKGARQKRRQENTYFLLSLVDHEELTDLEVSNFVNTTVSMFATLFGDDQKMEIWNEFVNLPEEEQENILKTEPSQKKKPTSEEQMATSSSVTTAEERHLREAEMVAAAGHSFNRIDKRIRTTLRGKRFPLGSLKKLEEEVLSCFGDVPDAVWVSIVPSSFDRLIMHGMCQYLSLLSRTINLHNSHLVEVEDAHNNFCPPVVLLSQYLEHYR